MHIRDIAKRPMNYFDLDVSTRLPNIFKCKKIPTYIS